DCRGEGASALTLPWWSFVGIRVQFGELLQAFALRLGQEVEVESGASNLLRQSARNAISYAEAVQGKQIAETDLQTKLLSEGFGRVLKSHQVRNICRLA